MSVDGRALPVDYATVHAEPAWDATAILTAETGVLVLLTMMLSVLLAHPAGRRLLPCAVGLATAVIIATFGPLSGGSANPARQFGPALLAQDTTHLSTCSLRCSARCWEQPSWFWPNP
ncbi:aquaporin [Streptomyces sp. NBC_00378]|uniref:aquaporin n=1 Tax=unclassified Streptomyces TaxID=2593676 RepID=UPI00225C0D9E|nr:MULTISPECIES: aquaporin [unclassified Streptomyces]MCX5114734.1 aquaporin [Streptomyces sp. NBC_00378]